MASQTLTRRTLLRTARYDGGAEHASEPGAFAAAERWWTMQHDPRQATRNTTVYSCCCCAR